MFADDVWNNMMAHTIINLHTESRDMYIFDIPEEIEIDSYSLMSDYISLTDKENISAEAAIETTFEEVSGDKHILSVKNITGHSPKADKVEGIYVAAQGNSFRYFITRTNPAVPEDGTTLWEITKDGTTLIDQCDGEGKWKSGAASAVEIIEKSIS